MDSKIGLGDSHEKNSLWIRGIHGKYLVNKDWWQLTTVHDVCWYLTKLCAVKEEFKWRSIEGQWWKWKRTTDGKYTLNLGYAWYMDLQNNKTTRKKIVWLQSTTPRHSFIAWLLLKQKLPVSSRLVKHIKGINTSCDLRNKEEQTQDHFFFTCTYAKKIWSNITKWLEMKCIAKTLQEWFDQLLTQALPKMHKDIL